jgi:hypothetical protein
MTAPAGRSNVSGEWVVRLFPRAWRARYGEELVAILELEPPNLRHLIGLLYCALDAHLDPQVSEGGEFSFMEGRPTMQTRIFSATAVGAGIVLVGGLFITDEKWIFVRLVIFYALAGVGLVGVHRCQSAAAPVLSWVGFVPVLVAYAVGLALLFPPVGDLELPAIAGRRFVIVAQEALWIGSFAFGVVTLAIGVLPRLAAAAFTVGAPMAMVGMFIGPTPAPELSAIAYAGITFYAIGLIWLGLSGWAAWAGGETGAPAAVIG